MQTDDLISRPKRCGVGAAVGSLTVLSLALLSVGIHRSEPHKVRTRVGRVTQIALAITSVVTVEWPRLGMEVSVEPRAGSSGPLRPCVIAAVVDWNRLQEVMVSRIGGLYGP